MFAKARIATEIGSLVLILAFAGPAPLISAAPQTKDSERIAQAQQKSQAIKSRVGEVIVPVTVTDHAGEVVLDLTQADFRIYDNGVERKIEHCDLGGDLVSVALVVETSSHIEGLMPAVRRTGIVFTETVMTQTGEAAVIGFDNAIDLLEQFTPDQEVVQQSIEHLQPGTSGSKLYDAMSRGVSLLEGLSPESRRVLVVEAEAQDRGSKTKLAEVVRHANLANVTIYSIGLSTITAGLREKPRKFLSPNIAPPGVYPLPTPFNFPSQQFEEGVQGNMDLSAVVEVLVRAGARPNVLAVASQATGGLHVNTSEDPSIEPTIEQAMDKIGGQLNMQYILAYHPSDDDLPGFHRIRVEVSRPGDTVRTRPGYYLAPSP